MIPKRIFYIWLGGEKTALAESCIHNWHKMLPDFEIIEINENSSYFDFEYEYKNCKWFKEVYDKKMWAYASDYIRCKVLYEHGGIYLDTDITIEKDLTPLLDNDFFTGDEAQKKIGFGIFGCTKHHSLMKEMINFYQTEIYKSDLYIITDIFTHILEKYPNDDYTIYNKKYFYPFYFGEPFTESCVTKDTYSIHWWAKSWINKKTEKFLKEKHLSLKEKLQPKIKQFIKNIFSIKNHEDKKHKLITILGLKFKFKRKWQFNPKKIVFANFNGRSLGCNPKYILEEIVRQNLNYDLVWLVKNPEEEDISIYPKGVRLVKFNSEQALRELETAKLWVDNIRKTHHLSKGLQKKENQYYIQTWHGSIGVKKTENAIPTINEKHWDNYRESAKIDSQYIDYFIAMSDFDKNMFLRDFWYSGEVAITGQPRNDILFRSIEEHNNIKAKVYKSLRINKNKKICLYVPTFRDDNDMSCINLDYISVKKQLEKQFGSEWVMVVRLHPNINDKELDLPQGVINATLYPEIMELLVASDIVISDYSSCLFDFALMNKPGFIYAEDVDKYEKERGFGLSLNEIPFSIANSNKELINNISKYNKKEYINKINEFYDKYHTIRDNQSSKRVVELIKGIMNDKK